jgi:hypothetical protein
MLDAQQANWQPVGTTFYPEIIPPEEGHPTTADFEVVNIGDERGKGLRARVAIRRGERVARLSGVVVNRSSVDTIQISPTLHMHDRWFCRLLLHNCEPNVVIDTAAMEAWAARSIYPSGFHRRPSLTPIQLSMEPLCASTATHTATAADQSPATRPQANLGVLQSVESNGF